MRLSQYSRRALLVNFVVWVAYITFNLSAFYFDSTRAGREFDLTRYAITYLISFTPWMLATPAFYYFLNRAKQSGWQTAQTLLILLICWSPIAFLSESFASYYMKPVENKSIIEVGLSVPTWYWIYNVLLFCAVNGICISLIYYRRSNSNRLEALTAKQQNAELQLQLSDLQMKSLQTQLEPHFLFNALNAIASLVRISEKQPALNAIKKLSDLLRYAVESSNHLYVSFDKELAFVKDYLSLQTLRFEDKLDTEINDKRAKHNQECPPFLLQIFVENAIRHGLEHSGEKMSLLVKIDEKDDQLCIFVQNNNKRKNKRSETLGIGLDNLRSRLEILYPEQFVFEYFQSPQHYTVEVIIPSHASN